jgi:hypothetical protein
VGVKVNIGKWEIKRLISTADMVKLINFYFVFHLINFFVD